MSDKTLNIRGTLTSLATPAVMGILNVTPDSFYSGSRKQTEKEIDARIQAILDEGGSMIDVGAYSSRPDAAEVSPEEEMKRLTPVLEILRKHYPAVATSVDTFRADVARRSVEEYGVAMINDISGGEGDAGMFSAVAALKVPYILMHMRGTPQTMQQHTTYKHLIEEIMLYFAHKLDQLRLLGVADVIIDPGFGFSKTVDQNYHLMSHLKEFALLECPLLVGVSRKSMIYRFLGGTPEDSLNGTTILNTFALLGGANILRVHDVKAAVEAVRITAKLSES